jgi:protein associated with RNAse G/E
VVFYEEVVFFVFIGFDALQEAKNPQKRNANWYFRFISNLFFICPVCLRFNGLENYLNFLKASPVTTAKNRLHIFKFDLQLHYCRIHFCDVIMLMGQSRVL